MFEAIFVLAAFEDRRNVLAWQENLPLRWVGLAIYLIGYAFSIWTNLTWIKHLQREGPRAMEHPVLLFEGPFKRIRYPSMLYLFIAWPPSFSDRGLSHLDHPSDWRHHQPHQ
jgi:hypothetical protein